MESRRRNTGYNRDNNVISEVFHRGNNWRKELLSSAVAIPFQTDRQTEEKGKQDKN